ncbi:MAG TPA: alpha-E domain-containing protein [Vicinamibacterales bacterium]|jgi:uncharacterized alpha-E superfamily protein|nr:alpha-E domain-containing protein [Vicinamibacterales bacterium]
MLLSRVADALYWISRYLERAEHTARLVDVARDLGLDRAAAVRSRAIERLYSSLGLPSAATDGEQSLVRLALFDTSHRNSVAACVMSARENARQVREEISSDMWEQLNDLFLRVYKLQDAAAVGRTHYVSRVIVEGVHLFAGVTDATMGHGEGWQYLQAGCFLERAASTATLLDAFLIDDADASRAALDQADWVALLRSCSALEGYCRRYTADVRPERVTEFLLLDDECPRSIRFAATRLEAALRAMARYSGRPGASRPERLSGRLRASLDYGQVDEILSDDPHAYLTGVSRQCAQIHSSVYQSYISYSIETALSA